MQSRSATTTIPSLLLLLVSLTLMASEMAEVRGQTVEVRGYRRSDESYIFSVTREVYSVASVSECAEKCEAETTFTCRAFVFTSAVLDCSVMPLNSLSKFTMSRKGYVLYERQDFLEDCVEGIGTDYRGTVAITASGIDCQKWSSNYPHKPNFSPATHPEAGLEENFCRNPDQDAKGPWCYTTSRDTRFNYCGVRTCPGDCYTCIGEDYRGKTSRTETGRECQRWDQLEPHRHSYQPHSFPERGLVNNYCRNPDGEPRPWCYTTDPEKRWEYCAVAKCEGSPPTNPDLEVTLTCVKGQGEGYRGTVSVTVSGRTCQAWDSQSPHAHRRRPEVYSCKGLEANYCRNPDGEKLPWCYTADPERRWEYCNVPSCAGGTTGSCYHCIGEDYRGTVAKTETGKDCQRWDEQTPHRHTFSPQSFAGSDLANNFCRNPNKESRPWCFTTDAAQRWEHCALSKCEGEPPENAAPELTTSCVKGTGEGYRGTVAITVSGKACQAWASQTPHSHTRTPDVYSCQGLVSNYCRNPDGEKLPWCYTADPEQRWEYCDVPSCGTGGAVAGVADSQAGTAQVAQPPQVSPEADCFTGLGLDYRGTASVTRSGLRCQAWESDEPHKVRMHTPEMHPDAGLSGKFCRNPDKDAQGPWCYTMDPRKQWEHCNIQRCPSGEKCGVQVEKPKVCMGRIVGGCPAKPHSWPWQVAIRKKLYSFSSQFRPHCGATLIDPSWILTAAHCVNSSDVRLYRVLLGVHNELAPEREAWQTVPVASIHTEPRGVDIALVKIATPAQLTDRVSLVCLPDPDQVLAHGTDCVITGWGETQGTGHEGVLKQAVVPIISNKVCNRREYLNGRVGDTQFCAGYPEGGTDTCSGDSGGPLVSRDRQRFVVHGVTSWGMGCAHRNKPGVYTRVSAFIPWIQGVMQRN
ncbi:plasminogen isoform X2 [Petromyzon marinus]|uniref:plasminogen isoform X2 n=1 Tax=Petromyzon marinus TaxID=7757 RepID=UPI003F72A717